MDYETKCKTETVCYFILWIGAVTYSIYSVFEAGTPFENYHDTYGDFKQGWLVRNRRKDAADYEWETSLNVLRLIWPWILIHLTISELLRRTCNKVVPHWQLLCALICVTYNCGAIATSVIILQPAVFELFHRFRANSKFVIWICEGFCLILICYMKSLHFEVKEGHAFKLDDVQCYMTIMAVFWMNLRCLSYYLDNVNSTEDHRFVNVLAYGFYLPTLFLGSFVGYSSFEKSQGHDCKTTLNRRLGVLLINICRFGFWLVFTELVLHFLYVNALSYQLQMVKMMNSWALYGYGYCMGQFFHLKYVVLYGLSGCLSRFEHIQAPAPPKCIGRIHLYSDMWKYFDRGLYKFLVTYIYRPALFYNKILASLLCFLFVYVWHGLEKHILIWVALNFMGVSLENLFPILFRSGVKLNINPWLRNQLICVVISPLLAVSAISNFYFFAGTQIGDVFMERFLYDNLLHSLSLLLFLYCCCHVSIRVKKWETHSNKKNCENSE